MKKILSLVLCAIMCLGALPCLASAEGTLTIEHVYGTTEVPANPTRICVLDGNALDTIHTLGLGENVATVRSTNEYPVYLTEYYTSDTIIALQTSTKNLPEGADPYEPYYSIDADLIITSAESCKPELYELISQIAPTVVLDYVSNNEGGMYAGVKANAAIIASIWGVEDKLAELVAPYDVLYSEVEAAVADKTCVITKGKADMNSVQIQANNNTIEEDGDEAIKDNERAGLMLNELGFANLSNEAPEEVSMNATSAAVKAAGDDAEAVAAVAASITSWIESVNPDYLFVIDKSYGSLEEVEAAGFQYAGVRDLTVYANGNMHFLAKEWTLSRAGLTGMFTMIDQIAEIVK